MISRNFFYLTFLISLFNIYINCADADKKYSLDNKQSFTLRVMFFPNTNSYNYQINSGKNAYRIIDLNVLGISDKVTVLELKKQMAKDFAVKNGTLYCIYPKTLSFNIGSNELYPTSYFSDETSYSAILEKKKKCTPYELSSGSLFNNPGYGIDLFVVCDTTNS